VEGRVLRVGETARGLVELYRGHPEVEQDAGDPGDPESLERLGEPVVDGVREVRPLHEARQALAGEGERVPVAVDADEPGAVEGPEHRLGVAAEAEGRVDDDGAGGRECGGEQLEASLEQDGNVEFVHGRAVGPGPGIRSPSVVT